MKNNKFIYLDPVLAISFTLITIIGLLILASASMPLAEKTYGELFYFFYKQVESLLIGVSILILMIFTPTSKWQQIVNPFFYFCLLMLLVVLILGVEVNGARRWLPLPGFRLQVSEVFKFALILYTANFISSYSKVIQNNIKILVLPVFYLCIASVLLLCEPDFGATVVVLLTFIGLLFLAGVPLHAFVSLILVALVSLIALAVLTPYRFQRLITFMHPWEYAYSSGYQLTQALISYGRGDWFGLGLGGSIQKLFFLPEAHTDFIFAILAEELGLFGVMAVILLYIIVIFRVFYYGYIAQKKELEWQAFIFYGFAIYFAVQTFISIGVNLGVLPTKGLTLPFLSYGRSSLIINCAFVGFILRCIVEVNDDNRIAKFKSILRS